MTDHSILTQQITYYDARAHEYDEQLAASGRYAFEPDESDPQALDLADAHDTLIELGPYGEVLELACGTGWWTKLLAERAVHLTAVDASAKMLHINHDRVNRETVDYVQADLFDWRPEQTFDFIFFSFWLSHVPESRFARFWETVHDALNSHGTVFFVDECDTAASIADETTTAQDGVVNRELENGRTYHVVKVFHNQTVLAQELNRLGWDVTIRSRRGHVFYGVAHRR